MSIQSFEKIVFNNKVGETTHVSLVTKPVDKTAPVVFNNTQNITCIGESVEIQANTRESVYKKIEKICLENEISLEEAMRAQLLEGVLGCAPEHIAKMPSEDIEKAIEALDYSLNSRFFKFPQKKEHSDYLVGVRETANERYIYKTTGRTATSNFFRKRATLEERLIKNNYLSQDKSFDMYTEEEISHAIDKYFSDMMSDAIKSGDKKKIEKSYEDVLKIYGDILIDTEDPKHKVLLISAINNLSITGRDTATKLLIASCGTNRDARAIVARGINKNHMNITCTPDALGNVMDSTSATSISNVAFTHMSEEEAKQAYQNLTPEAKEFFAKYGDLIEQLKTKDESALTEDEKLILLKANNGYYSQYAGALTGIFANVNISDENKVNFNAEINNSICEIGIVNDVYQSVANYAVAYPDSFISNNITEFARLMDRVTGGDFTREFSTILSNAKEMQSNKLSNNTPANSSADNLAEANQPNTKTGIGATTFNNTYYSSNNLYGSNVLICDRKDYDNISKLMLKYTTTLNNEDELKNDKAIPSDLISAVRTGVESFDAYLENNGALKTVSEVFNNIVFIPENFVVKKMIKMYEDFSSQEQAEVLMSLNNTALAILLPFTAKESLYSLEGETFTNFYATNQVEKAIQESKEKENSV